MKSIDELRYISNISKSLFDKIQRARKYLVINLHQKRTKGRPNARWKEDVKNDITAMGLLIGET